MTFDFFRNLVVHRVLVISANRSKNHVNRYDGYKDVSVIVCRHYHYGTLANSVKRLLDSSWTFREPVATASDDEIELFLNDVDVIVAFETPCKTGIFSHGPVSAASRLC